MNVQDVFADLKPRKSNFDPSNVFVDIIPKKEKEKEREEGFSEKANEVAGMVSDSLGSMKVPGVDEKILGTDLYADPAGEKKEPVVDLNTSEKESIKEKLQGVKEIGANLTLGAAEFIPSGIIKAGTIGTYRLLDSLGLVPEDKKMSDEEINKFKSVIDQSLNLGGVLEPKTEFGKKGLKTVSVPFEVLHEISSGLTGFIDEKKYPNLKEFANFATEAAALSALGIGGKKFAGRVRKFTKVYDAMETVSKEKLTPEQVYDVLIEKGADKGLAKEVSDVVKERGAFANIKDTVMMEKDKPVIKKAKEFIGLESKEKPVKVETEVTGFELGKEKGKIENVFSDLVPKNKDVGKNEEVLNNMTEAAVEGSKDLPVMEEVKTKEVKKLETPLDQGQQKHIDARIVGLGSLEAVKKEYKKADDASIYAREKAAEIYGGDPGVEVLKQKIVKPAGKYDTIGSGFDTQKGKVIPFKKEWQAKKEMKLAAQKAGADVSEYDVREENGGWVFQRREIEIPKSEKKLETPEVKENRQKKLDPIDDYISKEEFKNQDLDFVRSEMRKAVDDIMKGSKKKQIETLQKLKKFYKRKEDAGFLKKLDEKILKLEGGGKEKATASNQVLGKPGYKKGELVPWKMEHYATKKAKEMTEKTGVVWEKTGSKEKGWLVQETGEKVVKSERSKIDAVAGKKEKEPWELTWRQYSFSDKNIAKLKTGVIKAKHKRIVLDAIEQGKELPKNVLDDYADINKIVKEKKKLSGPKLTTGLDPVDGIKAVIQTGKDIKEALPHLKTLGEKFYTGGKQKYFDWQKKMKAAIGDAWGKVKHLVQKVWNEIKESHFIKKLFDQSGFVDITALQKVFGKAPKADSLYSKFIKAGVIKEDLMLSGIGGYLKELGRERVDWNEFKEIVSEGGGFGVEKKVIDDVAGKYSPYEFPEYNLAGGNKQSYKETLYKYNPNDGSRFIEDHWNEDGVNTMAHERGHDRIVDGDKDVRYVDEVQSKWHDKGGKEGYGKPVKIVTKEEFEARIKEIEDDLDAGIITQQQAETLAIVAEARMLQSKYQSVSVPNAPFKKSWPQMVMRDVISDAVARKKEGIAWSTGKIQEDRWPEVKTDYRSLYDKKIKKFMEKESGVKAELVDTKTEGKVSYELVELPSGEWAVVDIQNRDNMGTYRSSMSADRARRKLEELPKNRSEKVWYVPITDKLKTRYQDKQITVFDTVLNPIMNQNGNVNLGNLKKLGESVYSKKQSYFEWQKEVKRIVGDAWEKVKKFVGKIWKELKTPVSNERGSVTIKQGKEKVKDEVKLSEKDFTLFELEKGDKQVNTGKEANKNLKVGIKDAERVASLTTKGSKFRAFVPTEFMFDKYPEIRPLLSQAREVDKTVTKVIGEFAKELKKIEKKFPNKKEREKLGISWHYMNKSGEAAMKALGHEKPENVKYQELKDTLDPIFNYFVTEVNDIRVKLGKKPIKINKDYLTFYATENYITDFKNLATGNNQDLVVNNLILDDWGAIKARQNIYTKDSAPFAHVKRKGLREGIKLELDPLVVIARYGKEAINHINKSPLIAFTKELIKSDLIHPETGEKFNLSKDNLIAARDLSSWINKWGGQSNLNLPKNLERIGQRAVNNLTTAQLFGNLRTAIVQASALGPTAWKFGYFNTVKGISDITFGNKTIPFEESSALPTASWDVTADEFANAIGKSKLKKAGLATKEASAFFMKGIDYLARKATFATVYRSLKPLVKAGKLSKKEAVRITDAEVIRTQASGSTTEISPIQRNILGKMATLWQTFTINQLNFIMRDIVGVGGKKVGLVERNKRIFRTLFGVAMMGVLYEKVMGIQSPFPAPVQVLLDKKKDESDVLLMRRLLLELSEGLPFGGSVKFGSSVFGPIVDYAQDIVGIISGKGDYNQDILKIALYGNGNAKIKARLKVLELIGKAKGIPGTSQFVKYAKGRLRGEGRLRSAIGTVYRENEDSGSGRNYLKRATYQKRQTR